MAIAVAAYALSDLVHEVLGHGVSALLMPGVRILSLSSVALQTSGSSRFVAAAGSLANVLAGLVAMIAFRRLSRFSPSAYFLWLFGALNLMNGSGYPLYSAVLGSADWEVVVRGLQPAIFWRLLLGLVGVAAYAGTVVFAARTLARAVASKLVAREEIVRLIFPAYVAGGILLVAASAFNPISPVLILTSGVSSGFAAMAGLTVVPSLVAKWTAGIESGDVAIARSVGWIVGGAVIGILFVAVIGRGITF